MIEMVAEGTAIPIENTGRGALGTGQGRGNGTVGGEIGDGTATMR